MVDISEEKTLIMMIPDQEHEAAQKLKQTRTGFRDHLKNRMQKKKKKKVIAHKLCELNKLSKRKITMPSYTYINVESGELTYGHITLIRNATPRKLMLS